MKEMTPKERVMAFFRHEPVDELPTDEGIFVLFNPEAYKERPSHEHGGETGLEFRGNMNPA